MLQKEIDPGAAGPAEREMDPLTAGLALLLGALLLAATVFVWQRSRGDYAESSPYEVGPTAVMGEPAGRSPGWRER